MPDRYDDPNEYNWLMQEIMRHESWQAIALGQLLFEKLRPVNVIDFGCGPGIYGMYFMAQGRQYVGIDGASGAGQLLNTPASKFIWHDLRKPFIDVDHKVYDLALCIEVAEHIKPEYADVLMNSICNSADQVFFCAAKPGQGGEGHYNEQPKEYWLKKFSERGFEEHPLDQEIHRTIEIGEPYEHCHWLKWNSFLMRRKV